jgi:hypothetical protein
MVASSPSRRPAEVNGSREEAPPRPRLRRRTSREPAFSYLGRPTCGWSPLAARVPGVVLVECCRSQQRHRPAKSPRLSSPPWFTSARTFLNYGARTRPSSVHSRSGPRARAPARRSVRTRAREGARLVPPRWLLRCSRGTRAGAQDHAAGHAQASGVHPRQAIPQKTSRLRTHQRAPRGSSPVQRCPADHIGGT